MTWAIRVGNLPDRPWPRSDQPHSSHNCRGETSRCCCSTCLGESRLEYIKGLVQLILCHGACWTCSALAEARPTGIGSLWAQGALGPTEFSTESPYRGIVVSWVCRMAASGLECTARRHQRNPVLGFGLQSQGGTLCTKIGRRRCCTYLYR